MTSVEKSRHFRVQRILFFFRVNLNSLINTAQSEMLFSNTRFASNRVTEEASPKVVSMDYKKGEPVTAECHLPPKWSASLGSESMVFARSEMINSIDHCPVEKVM